MIAFSDGVVAIAITLLILPLATITLPPDDSEAANNPLQFVWHENEALIAGFVISWAVIFIFWLAHHRIFANVKSINGAIIRLNTLWLFAVIVLPFPTNLISQVGHNNTNASRQITVFYVGTMLIMSLTLSLMGLVIRRHPELLKDPNAASTSLEAQRGWAVSIIMALVLVAAFIIPQKATYGLLALIIIEPVFQWRSRRAAASPNAISS